MSCFIEHAPGSQTWVQCSAGSVHKVVSVLHQLCSTHPVTLSDAELNHIDGNPHLFTALTHQILIQI